MHINDNKIKLSVYLQKVSPSRDHKEFNYKPKILHNLRQTVKCIPSTTAETPSPFPHTTSQHKLSTFKWSLKNYLFERFTTNQFKQYYSL